jgi:hypothetical protein
MAVVDATDKNPTSQYLAHLPNALFAKFNGHRLKEEIIAVPPPPGRDSNERE